MRTLAVDARLAPEVLGAALGSPAPLLLDLLAAPAGLDRLPFLLALARFDGVLVARFSGCLGTPLVEAALLAPLARWSPGSTLDLRGALLAPLLSRLGRARATAVLLVNGPVLEPGVVLSRHEPDDRSRSPLALATARALVGAPPSGLRGPLARERAAFAWLLTAGEKVEGLAAFRERRPPAFGW